MKWFIIGGLSIVVTLPAWCTSPAVCETASGVPISQGTEAEPGVSLAGWGESLGSEKLDDWIRAGLASAPSVVSAERAVRVEDADEDVARARGLPAATIEGDLRGGWKQTEMTGGEERAVEPIAGRISAAWDLDI